MLGTNRQSRKMLSRIEKAARFNETAIAFLKKVHARLGVGAEAA